MKRLLLNMSLILFVSACSADAKIEKEDVSKEWEPSPVFISEDRDMIGIEGKIGLLGAGIIAGEPSKQMWHFWGDDLLNKYVSVEAYHEGVSDEVNPLVRGEEYPLGFGVNGADYSHPSHLQFPEPGVWKMDVYLNEEFYESIVIEVN
ncbi:DUF4871 domain-containing protein [Evansella clarkii]|uniref:DUF4871 domain-containing protein n=1 Tax=Evansella clarkii TaxID=79879 RepID=UPI0009976DEF|nr:DUF4871 domain-containing protein [Evansella clarkii]